MNVHFISKTKPTPQLHNDHYQHRFLISLTKPQQQCLAPIDDQWAEENVLKKQVKNIRLKGKAYKYIRDWIFYFKG